MNDTKRSSGLTSVQPDLALAERLFAELKERTGTPQGITRTSYGLGEQIAHEMVRREARKLGLEVATDAACNLYMTYRGQIAGKGIFIGSHLDSVPRGGNYDGAAGVLMGLSVISGFRSAGAIPPRDITVMAIRAEESTWFGASYIGSRAAFGQLAPDELKGVLRATDRMALGGAIDAAGGDSIALRAGEAFLTRERVGLFLEAHIEQGPVLVEEKLPVGIVTGICGSFRHRAASCHGSYSHSGATPRAYRADAVRAAATLVVQLDAAWMRLADEGHAMTVTFCQFATDPDEAAFSKVAGRVGFSLDVRSESIHTLELMRRELAAAVSRISTEQHVRFDLGPETTSEPGLMDPRVIAGLKHSAEDMGVAAKVMPCGAGHDAAVFAKAGVPTGMIFVRNQNGSHNPHEHMEISDFGAAASVLSHLCLAPPDVF
jgi:N-carbamoyl-L-amino-acid hydrolase